MSINSLRHSKFFNNADKMFKFTDKMSKLNFADYYIPEDLYMGRIDSFKGYKMPFVKEVYDAIKSKRIIPVLLSESSNTKKNLPNLHLDAKFPQSIFNMNSYNDNGKVVSIVDLSYKGTYQRAPTGEIVYLDIPDLTMFYMSVAGYVNMKITEKPELTEYPNFFNIISETYALILSRIIDTTFLVASSSGIDYNKLFFLCNCFCLQNMFCMSKDKAVEYSLKMRMVVDKKGVIDNSLYIQTPDLDFMENGVDYITKFPLDSFCEILLKEYAYINAKKFNAVTLMIKFNDKLTRNAVFCMESLTSFITMIILSKGSLGIYNDMMVKTYLDLQKDNILKELAQIVK